MEKDEKIRILMKTLAETISQVFNENDEIKNTISMIEKEGYRVDLILATITKISKKGEDEGPKISDFDRSFLKKIRIRFDEEEN